MSFACKEDKNINKDATLKMIGGILFCLILGYASLSLGLIIERNIAGEVSLLYLAFFTLFIIYFRNSFNLLMTIICIIPAFNVYHELLSLKLILLMLPVIFLFYLKLFRIGLINIFKNKKIFIVAVLLLTAGLILSLANAFIRGTFDKEMIVQVCLLCYELSVLALIIVSVNTKDKFIKALYILLVPATALIVLVIIYSIYSNIWVILYSVKGKNIEIGDRLIHANLVAMIIMPIMIATFPAILHKKMGFIFFTYIIIFPIAMITLILTSSRGSWVGFIGGMGYLFYKLRRVKYFFIIIIVVLIVGILFSGYVVRRFSQTNKFDGSILERLILWRAAIKYITSSPLIGLGPNYFRIEKYKLGVPANAGPANAYSTHNIILEIFVNYGLLSLMGFIIFISKLMINNNRLINSVTEEQALYNISINAALIATLIHSMFDCNIANVAYMTLLMTLIGLAYVLTTNTSLFKKKQNGTKEL